MLVGTTLEDQRGIYGYTYAAG